LSILYESLNYVFWVIFNPLIEREHDIRGIVVFGDCMCRMWARILGTTEVRTNRLLLWFSAGVLVLDLLEYTCSV
jgi:hypothetical protein